MGDITLTPPQRAQVDCALRLAQDIADAERKLERSYSWACPRQIRAMLDAAEQQKAQLRGHLERMAARQETP